MRVTEESINQLSEIIGHSGEFNFNRKQGSWGRFEKICTSITGCGWKMGMCKSSSGKDNAINRLYTTGAIRSYPDVLIQCLFVDDYVEEISEVYRSEYSSKMRCSPILVLATLGHNGTWSVKRVLVQDKHPLMPFSQNEISQFFPNSEIECVETESLIPTKGWGKKRNVCQCLFNEWGEIKIISTKRDSKGDIYTTLTQVCATPGCDKKRTGKINGVINWDFSV
jgi:hypothetical protein